MNFTRPIFILFALPIVVLVNSILPARFRKYWIALISIGGLFLTQPYYLVFYLLLAGVNYGFAFLNAKATKKELNINWPLILIVVINIGLLVLFKWTQSFSFPFQNIFSVWLPTTGERPLEWIFPLGLSYTIFQLLSYQMDISSEIIEVEKDPVKFLNYSLFYPKMHSGPIQRYDTFKPSLDDPAVNIENINRGLRRFILGLAKKVLIADVLVRYIDPVFAMKNIAIPTLHAWFILILLAIQIYYDFSGMIDMALGVAQMLGFTLSENFDHPFISKSVTEFWRRWHITLGAWFRDYVFIPLQFRVRKIKGFPIQLITVFIFLLTGLWHGFDEHFIAWGLLLGVVIAIENTKVGKNISQAWKPLQYIWTLGWISLSWLVFRASDLDFVYRYLRNLIGLQGEIQILPFSQTKPYPIFENSVFIAALFGILFAIPFYPWLKGKIKDFVQEHQKWYWVVVIADSLLLLLLLIFCIGMIVYNGPLPGVYDKF